MIFNFFQAYCLNYKGDDPNISCNSDMHIIGVGIEVWGLIAMLVMLIEMSIYLAYYKDVFFSLITLVNYIGMFLYNKEK
jgi:hypothetical protein